MASKPSLMRKGTMAVTAKEGSSLLGKGKARPDVDAATRAQSRQIKALLNEKPKKGAKTTPKKATATKVSPKKASAKKPVSKKSPKRKPSPKKPKLSKASTMAGTAKEAKALLGGEKLGDTRQVTKAKKGRPSLKKAGTMDRTIAESAWTTGTTRVDVNSPLKTRKRKSSAGRGGSSAKKAKPAAKPRTAKPKAAKSKVTKAKAGAAAKGRSKK